MPNKTNENLWIKMLCLMKFSSSFALPFWQFTSISQQQPASQLWSFLREVRWINSLSQKEMDGALFLTTGVTKGTLCQLHAAQGYCDRSKHTNSLTRFMLLSLNNQNWCRPLSCTPLQPVPQRVVTQDTQVALLSSSDTQEEGEARDVRCNNN